MRSIDLTSKRKLAVLLFILLAGTSIRGYPDEVERDMWDPFLALTFEPRISSYEKLPDSLQSGLGSAALHTWIFASYQDPEKPEQVYMVLGSLVRVDNPSLPNGVGSTPNNGGVFLRNGDRFKGLFEPSDLDIAKLPDGVTDGLCKDFVARSLKVYGGTEKLKKKIETDWRLYNGIAPAPYPIAKAFWQAGIKNVCGIKIGCRTTPVPPCPCMLEDGKIRDRFI
jgi:hypothetical protein